MKKVGIYIHIPFCKKRCNYCNFISSDCANEAKIESYFHALKTELMLKSKALASYVVDSIYFGGGTPSFVGEKYIADTLACLKSLYNVASDAEISMEANPDSLILKNIETYLSAGINRFSIGLQTYDDEQLKLIGRPHSISDFENCINKLHSLGIENISADIMLGLPLQTKEQISTTVAKLVSLNIPHISAYGLKLEKGTKMYNDSVSGKIKVPTEDSSADFYEQVLSELDASGILRYEVSNFAKKGYECRHNLKYWKREEYLGFGIAAHSFINSLRLANTENFSKYIDFFKEGLEQKEQLMFNLLTKKNNEVDDKNLDKMLKVLLSCSHIDAAEEEFEYIMLNLRLSEGINRKDFANKFNNDIFTRYSKVFTSYKDFFTVDDDKITVNNRGFMVLNSLLTEFMD